MNLFVRSTDALIPSFGGWYSEVDELLLLDPDAPPPLPLLSEALDNCGCSKLLSLLLALFI